MAISPKDRKDLFEMLDLALSLGCRVSVNIHPRHKGDSARIVTGGPRLPDSITVSEHNPETRWSTFLLGDTTDVLLFGTREDLPARPAPVPNGSVVSRVR